MLDNDSDGNDDPLTAALASAPEHGDLMLDGDGSFTYTPDADFNGSDSFTYRAGDGGLESDPATVTIDVSAVDDPPASAPPPPAADDRPRRPHPRRRPRSWSRRSRICGSARAVCAGRPRGGCACR